MELVDFTAYMWYYSKDFVGKEDEHGKNRKT